MKSVKVTVVQQDDPYHFRSTNEQGHAVDTDNSGAYDSGIGSGVSPMELLIIAIGSCSGIDIVDILKKGKQEINKFEIDIVGQKPAGVAPSPFQTIHLSFRFEGDLEEKK